MSPNENIEMYQTSFSDVYNNRYLQVIMGISVKTIVILIMQLKKL